jgi:hypothetical protein
VARNAGHELNHRLIREIAERAWRWEACRPGSAQSARGTAHPSAEAAL